MAKINLIQKIAPKRFSLSKTMKKRLKAANKRLMKFANKKLKTNDVTMYRNLIKSFNKRYGIKGDMFNPMAYYSKQMKKELKQLIDSIYANPKTSYSYWKKRQEEMTIHNLDSSKLGEGDLNMDMVEKLHNQFGLTTEQDFIDFFDEMDRFRNTSVLSQILDSDEEVDLVAYGKEMDLDITEIHELILNEYQRTGRTHTDLYNTVFDALSNYEKYGTYRGDEEE